jgi:hypothetical protein
MRATDKRRDADIKRVLPAIRKAVRAQMLAGAAAFSAGRDVRPAIEAGEDELNAALSKVFVSVAAGFGAAIWPEVQPAKGGGFPADDFNRAAAEFSASSVRGGTITGTTRRAVEAIVRQAAAEGLSIPNTAALINTFIEQTYRGRATTIARTEVISASNYGVLEAAEQAGAAVRKSWLATFDGRTRQAPEDEYDHVAMHGRTVKMKEKFNAGGDLLRFPGDPSGHAANIINCRCAVRPRI